MQEEIGCLHDEVSRVSAELVEQSAAAGAPSDEALEERLQRADTDVQALTAKLNVTLEQHGARLAAAEAAGERAERAAAAACEQLAGECEKLAAASKRSEQVKEDVAADLEGLELRAEARAVEQCALLKAELQTQLEKSLDELRLSQQEAWTKELDEARAETWRVEQESTKLTILVSGLSEHMQEVTMTVRGFEDLVNTHSTDVQKKICQIAEDLDRELRSELGEVRDVTMAAVRGLEGTLDEKLAAARRDWGAEIQQAAAALRQEARQDIASARQEAEAAAARLVAAEQLRAEALGRSLSELQRQHEELRGISGERQRSLGDELRTLGDELRRSIADGLAARSRECDASKAATREALSARDAEAERRAMAAERHSQDALRALEAQVAQRFAAEAEAGRAALQRQGERLEAGERELRGWRASAEAEQQLLRRALEEHREALHELSRRGAMCSERLEELAAELFGALRQEVTAAAVSSFQGEMRLWKGMVLQGRNSTNVAGGPTGTH